MKVNTLLLELSVSFFYTVCKFWENARYLVACINIQNIWIKMIITFKIRDTEKQIYESRSSRKKHYGYDQTKNNQQPKQKLTVSSQTV